MNSLSRVILGFRIASAVVSAPVYAQIGGSANIAGVVSDDSGGALPGVTVTLTNTANGRAQTIVTGSDGRFRAVALLPPGRTR